MFQFWVVPGASYAVAVSRREGENSYGSHAERFSFSTSADTCGYSGGVSNRRRRCESTRRARSVYRQRGCIKEADEVMAGCRMHGRILSCNGPRNTYCRRCKHREISVAGAIAREDPTMQWLPQH